MVKLTLRQFYHNSIQCHLWLGARTGNGLYGRKSVTFPDGSNKLMRVSRVVYMIKHQSLIIPVVNEQGHILEMSHLCHTSLCVNPDHLVLEKKITNSERKHCRNQGCCTKKHQPFCIL